MITVISPVIILIKGEMSRTNSHNSNIERVPRDPKHPLTELIRSPPFRSCLASRLHRGGQKSGNRDERVLEARRSRSRGGARGKSCRKLALSDRGKSEGEQLLRMLSGELGKYFPASLAGTRKKESICFRWRGSTTLREKKGPDEIRPLVSPLTLPRRRKSQRSAFVFSAAT